MKRADIIKAIYKERTKQDEQWGGREHDKLHSLQDWATIVDSQLEKFFEDSVTMDAKPEDRFIKIAAICFAALEIDNRDRIPMDVRDGDDSIEDSEYMIESLGDGE